MTELNSIILDTLVSSTNKLTRRELSSKSTAEKFSLSSVLSSMYGFKDIFISSEIIPPGRKSSSPHFHSKKEELVFVLQGNPTIHFGEHSRILNPGEFIGFPLHLREKHHIENLTNQQCHILLISSKCQDDTVNY